MLIGWPAGWPAGWRPPRLPPARHALPWPRVRPPSPAACSSASLVLLLVLAGDPHRPRPRLSARRRAGQASVQVSRPRVGRVAAPLLPSCSPAPARGRPAAALLLRLPRPRQCCPPTALPPPRPPCLAHCARVPPAGTTAWLPSCLARRIRRPPPTSPGSSGDRPTQALWSTWPPLPHQRERRRHSGAAPGAALELCCACLSEP